MFLIQPLLKGFTLKGTSLYVAFKIVSFHILQEISSIQVVTNRKGDKEKHKPHIVDPSSTKQLIGSLISENQVAAYKINNEFTAIFKINNENKTLAVLSKERQALAIFLRKHNTHHQTNKSQSKSISHSHIELYDLNTSCGLQVLRLMAAASFHFSVYRRVSDYKYLWTLFTCYKDSVLPDYSQRISNTFLTMPYLKLLFLPIHMLKVSA